METTIVYRGYAGITSSLGSILREESHKFGSGLSV